MIRMAKAISLIFAVFIASAVTASSSAQAADGELHAGASGSAVITAQQTQQHVFQTQAGQVSCTTADFEGTVSGEAPQVTTDDVTLTATYSSCEAFGFTATVKMNGCKYTITGGQPEALTALIDVVGCTAGKQIEVNAGGGLCVATVPEQSGLSHVTFENKAGPPEDVEAQLTISGIGYELHGPFCPGGGATGLRNNGTYTGKATARAYEDLGTQQTTEHDHQFGKVVDGEQTRLVAT